MTRAFPPGYAMKCKNYFSFNSFWTVPFRCCLHTKSRHQSPSPRQHHVQWKESRWPWCVCSARARCFFCLRHGGIRVSFLRVCTFSPLYLLWFSPKGGANSMWLCVQDRCIPLHTTSDKSDAKDPKTVISPPRRWSRLNTEKPLLGRWPRPSPQST